MALFRQVRHDGSFRSYCKRSRKIHPSYVTQSHHSPSDNLVAMNWLMRGMEGYYVPMDNYGQVCEFWRRRPSQVSLICRVGD